MDACVVVVLQLVLVLVLVLVFVWILISSVAGNLDMILKIRLKHQSRDII